jgi:hypothetical protein
MMAAPSNKREDQDHFVIASTFGADERLGDMNPDASIANGGIGFTRESGTNQSRRVGSHAMPG